MKRKGIVYLGTAILLCLALPALAGVTYSGSLSSTAADQILGSGVWIEPGVTTLDWTVLELEDSSWLYTYELSVPIGEVSHLILQVSPTFTEQNIIATSGTFGNIEINTFTPGGGNPGMPGEIYGLKFDEAFGLVATFELHTDRHPMWGHVYAKDGNVGGDVNTAYNAGFKNVGESRIMVPNTDDIVPEPAGLLALMVGMTSLAGYGIRLRKRG